LDGARLSGMFGARLNGPMSRLKRPQKTRTPITLAHLHPDHWCCFMGALEAGPIGYETWNTSPKRDLCGPWTYQALVIPICLRV
jgi:hypothetical protein